MMHARQRVARVHLRQLILGNEIVPTIVMSDTRIFFLNCNELCQMVFTAILWVKLLEIFATQLSLKYAMSVGQ